MQLGARRRWTAWNDWSELDWGAHPKHFDAIPQATEWKRQRGDVQAAAFIWFIGTVEEGVNVPNAAVTVEGTLMRVDGRSIDLMEHYRAAPSVAQLVVSTAGDLLD